MRVLICGASGKHVPKALDKLHADFGIYEVIHGASCRRSGVDIAASDWVDRNRVPYRIVPASRDAAHVASTRPDLVVLATTTGNSHRAVRVIAWELRIPVLVLSETGELLTVGRGWGTLLRAVLARQTRVYRKVAG